MVKFEIYTKCYCVSCEIKGSLYINLSSVGGGVLPFLREIT